MHRADSSPHAPAVGGAPLFAPSAVGCAFADLPTSFYTRVAPRPLTDSWLAHANPDAAGLLELDAAALRTPEFLALCSGAGRLPGIDPVATVYSGHQFGVWAGQLGDGRAHLLGDVRGPQGRWEVQLKGSGRTPYSRMGDGWAVLRSSVREYLASQAMAGLGVPTTLALALTASSDPVIRETQETAAVVTRLAPSFVRFGHFEHWARSATEQAALLDHVVEHWFQDCREGPADRPDRPATACRLLEEVTRRTARLMAQWQLVGFCHGVMNTDNMSILGLTLDYGPYGFMDAFQANHVCNHSDTLGRYAWNAQPAVAQWNLTRLAESLLVLGCAAPDLEAALAPFERTFLQAYHAGLAQKFGFADWRPQDADLGDAWWALLHAQRADFTLAFRRLADVGADAQPWLDLFADAGAARQWLDRYRARLTDDPRPQAQRKAAMDRVNPLYVLRNHLAQQAIEAAGQGDSSEIDRLMALLRDPYAWRPGHEADARPPAPDVPVVAVSCSS
ncbi:protein adenylyltransferase SelO [uncultured Castellaniella sp.]|uniref:protein adenylyltransferase SelO n=1 Tax=uncultured Castellaniella sp. TaxID=647907 RepID=UPI002631DEFB|nr:YdiU family protein [uncultured Castellaniella sp.]